MKKTDIESFLRENKPRVKDNPTFLLEVQQKMHAVDGIKSEVERQRRYGRQAIIAALFAGVIFGGIIAALTYLYPISTELVGENHIADLKTLIDPWKHYILLLVAGCAVSLGVIFSTRRENAL
jgi:hypothetical protein